MSFAKDTENIVELAIKKEYENACKLFGEKYHSLHEGYAVLLEEIEEVKFNIKDLRHDLKCFWESIKENNDYLNKDGCFYLMKDVQESIKELAQVGAVLMKIKNTVDKDTNVLTK